MEIVLDLLGEIAMFFIGLFMVVGGLEQTGTLTLIAEFIGRVSGDNAMLMAAIILWISAFASAFVDNIPFAATMIPVIKSLAATQVYTHINFAKLQEIFNKAHPRAKLHKEES